MPEEPNINVPEDSVMGQNDRVQLEHIERSYTTGNGRGIAHGLQKDAIQNGIGARIVSSSEPKSYTNWQFDFWLHEINGDYALTFQDRGTTGLIGSILTPHEIQQWSNEGRLTPNQCLARFMTRFESGGNLGPGSFGRGKLLFQAASANRTILCETLRYDDNKYLAFKRHLSRNQIMQTTIPFEGELAQNFVRDLSGGILHPLNTPGTRITIFKVNSEVIESIKNSFEEELQDYNSSFAKMIAETWWEIITSFNAKIFIHYNDKTIEVKVEAILKDIISSKANCPQGVISDCFEESNLSFVARTDRFKIKKLKIVVSRNELPDCLQGIWIQRKRMKIGPIKSVRVHHRINYRVAGYVILDEDLEYAIQPLEDINHYSIHCEQNPAKQIRETVRKAVSDFQESLGLGSSSNQNADRQDILEVLQEVASMAPDLGLVTSNRAGVKKPAISIRIESFTLPNLGSKRVNEGQEVGPIRYIIKNTKNSNIPVKLRVSLNQKGSPPITERIHDEDLLLEPNQEIILDINAFKISSRTFKRNEGIMVFGQILSPDTQQKIDSTGTMLWFEREPPEIGSSPFNIKSYNPEFPHPETSRVMLTESIRNIGFKIKNNSSSAAKINLDLSVRKSSDYSEILILKSIANQEIGALSELEINHENLDIDITHFGAINSLPATTDDRKCEIYLSVRLAEHHPEIGMRRNDIIGKKKIFFYIGIDPPGSNIFDRQIDVTDPNEPRSDHIYNESEGHVFKLNVRHACYEFAEGISIEAKKYYIKEQVIRQAFIVTIKSEKYEGLLEEYKDELSAAETSSAEVSYIIEKVVSDAMRMLT